jgi:2,4-dienoyl-CoA reductase-like NADH-dependent reductase (Old Yellow Enzyme family)
MPKSAAPLFTPFTLNGLTLKNRIVMAPMTRAQSPGGAPNEANAAYYRRRAESGVGLIITEGTTIGHDTASMTSHIPYFAGKEALAGWKRVADEVHAAGGRIMPQLWHTGMQRDPAGSPHPELPSSGPSGLDMAGEKKAEPMTKKDIKDVVDAFARGAADARANGFDGVEVHGAHGYLLDQFFWDVTNKRSDEYGGDLTARARIGVEVIEAIRREVGKDYPVILRLSQWKLGHFDTKIATTPEQWGAFLKPLADAGVDMFHCSQRRFWQPEFEGSPLSLSAWTKKLSGKPVMNVGSVGLSGEFVTNVFTGAASEVTGLDDLITAFERGDFDLIAVGRALLNDHEWAAKIRDQRYDALKPLDKGAMTNYY